MNPIENLIISPWPWYISGPLLGLTVPILLLLGNKQLGISSSFCHFWSTIGLKKIELFNYDWRSQKWNIIFIFGVFLAGVVVAFLGGFQFGELSETALQYFGDKSIEVVGLFPEAYFTNHIYSKTTILLVLGGFLIGFGSRYANGCTAGHAIMGLSLLSPGSLVAVVGFFIGGLLGTLLILDNFL